MSFSVERSSTSHRVETDRQGSGFDKGVNHIGNSSFTYWSDTRVTG